MTKFEKTIQIEGKVGKVGQNMLCSECGKEFNSEETIFEVISVPDSSFKSHVLARYCSSCFERIREEFKKTMGHDLIEVD